MSLLHRHRPAAVDLTLAGNRERLAGYLNEMAELVRRDRGLTEAAFDAVDSVDPSDRTRVQSTTIIVHLTLPSAWSWPDA